MKIQLQPAQKAFLVKIVQGQPIDAILAVMWNHDRILGRWMKQAQFRKALDESLISAATLRAIRERQKQSADELVKGPDLSIPDNPLRDLRKAPCREAEERAISSEERESGDELQRLY